VLCAALFYLHVTREKLPKRLSYEKGAHKMLIKLTPGVLPFCLKTLQKKIIRKKLWNISDKNGRGLGSIYSSKAAHKVSLNTDSCNLPEAIELSPIGANYNLDNSNQHSRLLLAFKEQNC